MAGTSGLMSLGPNVGDSFRMACAKAIRYGIQVMYARVCTSLL